MMFSANTTCKVPEACSKAEQEAVPGYCDITHTVDLPWKHFTEVYLRFCSELKISWFNFAISFIICAVSFRGEHFAK